MSRLNNIHLTYLIVQEYNKKTGKPIPLLTLIGYICKKTGKTKKTAEEYINALKSGIAIEDTIYSIKYYNGGYQ